MIQGIEREKKRFYFRFVSFRLTPLLRTPVRSNHGWWDQPAAWKSKRILYTAANLLALPKIEKQALLLRAMMTWALGQKNRWQEAHIVEQSSYLINWLGGKVRLHWTNNKPIDHQSCWIFNEVANQPSHALWAPAPPRDREYLPQLRWY